MASIEQTLRQMSNETTAKTFAFNRQEAQKARDFEKSMSNTSHQREVADLKRAGLNPVLSANGGANAYSASSASGQADNSAIGLMASIYQTKLNNDNARKIAQMELAQKQRDNVTSLKIAKINQAASNYASNMSASASQYSADTSAGASRYSTDMQPHAQTFRMIDDLLKNKSSSAKKRAKGGYVVGSGILKTLAGVGSSILPALLRRKK